MSERSTSTPSARPAARLARHDARHLGGQLGRLLGRHVLGHRRRRHVEAGELLAQERDRGGLGALVHAVERRQAGGRPGSRRPARWPGSSAARSGGATRSAPRGARRSRGRRSRTRRSARALPISTASRFAASARATSRAASSAVGPRLLGAGAPGEDLVHLAVGEALVAADPRAVEGDPLRPRRRPAPARRSPRACSSPGAQRAGARWRAPPAASARPPRARTRSCARRSASRVQRAARAHVRGHVGDVDPDAHAAVLAAGGDRVVEVPGVVGIDREGGQRREVDARVGGERVVRGGSASAVAARG